MTEQNKHSFGKSKSENSSKTERQEGEQAITAEDFRNDDKSFRNFVEDLPVLFYAVEPKAPYSPIYVSPAFAAFGYPLEDWRSDPDIWLRIIHPDDREWVFNETKTSTKSGKEVEYEYRILAADGKTHWVRDRGYLVQDKKTKSIHRRGVIFDITDQKQAEGDLKESEARYRNLFENANDIIYVHDFDGNYLSINGAAEKVFGYSRKEALSMNMSQIAAPEHLPLAKEKLKHKVEGVATQTTYEADCITKDGSRLTLEVNSGVIYKDGLPIAVQGIARDITERKRTEKALIRSEKEYRDLFENANDLIYTHDLKGNFTSINRTGETITGYTREEAMKMNIAQVVAPEFLKSARKMITQKIAGKPTTAYDLDIIAKNGSRVSLELSTRLIMHEGRPVGVQGIGRDITERKTAEQSLHKTVSLFASTFESTADGIIVMSPDRRIVTCNRKFIEMWQVPEEIIKSQDGYSLTEFVLRQLTNPMEFTRNLDYLYSNPLAISNEMLELTDGRVYERYSQPQFMEGKPIGRVCCFRDITERERAEEKLRHYALHDTLTNLPNRVEFMNQLKQAVDRTQGNEFARFAVLFLDLDRFKVINDSLGHVVGDKLLIAIAERLKASIRPGDVVARLGGDEFTILLNRTGGVLDVARVAERLQRKLSEPFKIDNYEVFTTASIGIILSDDVQRQPEDFLRDADTAMYRAKEAGKARYEIFDRDMHAHNMNVLQLETDLRHAVDRGEFEVFYQPVVELESGAVSEFEALIRWRHPKHGLVLPDLFIEVAEETGMIIPIGKWILEQACMRTAQWQLTTSVPLFISVNLSAKQLMHPSLTVQVNEILDSTGLDPRRLKLEVTESTVMEHSDRSLKVLSELANLGITLSTDDFGTGYSSLSYLHRYPFNRLKIDRSFVRKMDEDEKSEAIVKTILLLGENLNIEVVAEGIETEFQLHLLRTLGCRLGQGYLFSEPVNAKTAEKLLPKDLKNPVFNDAIYTLDGGNILQAREIQ